MAEPSEDDASRLRRLVERCFVNFVVRFRWLFVIWFILPATLVYNTWLNFRNWFIFNVGSAPLSHTRKVAKIQRQVQEWNRNGRKTRMCTARPGWSTMGFRYPKYKNELTLIDTDQLVDILEINLDQEYVHVEPMVTMGQLTKYLLPTGYTLPVVPELEDLTVGGLINGCGVESSSRKYGLFQEICLSYELVVADGSLITIAKGKSKLGEAAADLALFYGIPWSHGTLGLLVSAKLRIIPSMPYVKLTYAPCCSKEILVDTLNEEASNRENEFVEALQFTENSGVVMTGVFTDVPPKNQTVNEIGKWYKPWFFEYVRGISKSRDCVTEYIPLRDYYHRHSRSIFWEIKDIIPFGNSLFFRFLLGWAVPPKVSFLKATTFKPLKKLYENHHIIQDLLVPMNSLKDALDLIHNEAEVYPIWLCPFLLHPNAGILRQRSGRKLMFCDVGVYGNFVKEESTVRDAVRKFEKFLCSVSGFQMLYADMYMDKSEFWDMFDSALYEWLRVKYGCREAFPDIYEKVCRAARE